MTTIQFSQVAKRKLEELQAAGWTVNGLAIHRQGARGLIDNLGAVHWIDAPDNPEVAQEKWPARFGCNGPEGSFWTDDADLANRLIAATFDRDEWTVTDTQPDTP